MPLPEMLSTMSNPCMLRMASAPQASHAPAPLPDASLGQAGHLEGAAKQHVGGQRIPGQGVAGAYWQQLALLLLLRWLLLPPAGTTGSSRAKF